MESKLEEVRESVYEEKKVFYAIFSKETAKTSTLSNSTNTIKQELNAPTKPMLTFSVSILNRPQTIVKPDVKYDPPAIEPIDQKKKKAYRHIQSSAKNKPYKCEICKTSFTLPCNLIRHRHIHTDNRLHKCKICKKGFTRSDYFKRHIQIHTAGEASLI